MYYIAESITDEYLIDHYGFEKEKWHDHYNLVNRNEEGMGLHIWWADRNVKILLGEHAEYGIMPVPDVLVHMLEDKIIIKKEDEE